MITVELLISYGTCLTALSHSSGYRLDRNINLIFPHLVQCLENPVRTNQIPRQIPEQSMYTRPLPGIIMGGVLPFGCIFIQLFFILNSIWSSQTYYMFGFLFLVFLILVVTCSETTVLLCYFHLCAEVMTHEN